MGARALIQTDCEVRKANSGVISGFTVMVTVTGGAQGSEVLLKVYEPVWVLLTVAGVQVPVIPLSEVVGNTGAGSPAHKVRY